MAVTSLSAPVSGASFTSLLMTGLSPAQGALLIAHVVLRDLTTTLPGTMSDDIVGSTGWTALNNPPEYVQTNYRRIESYWTIVPANPGTSRTITYTPTEAISEGLMEVIEYTGDLNTETPILQSASFQQDSGSTFSVTLGAAPTTGNTVIGVLWNRGAGTITTGVGYTQVNKQSHDTSDFIHSQYAVSPGSAIVPWDAVVNSGSVGIAYEIDAAVISATNNNGIVGLLSGF